MCGKRGKPIVRRIATTAFQITPCPPKEKSRENLRQTVVNRPAYDVSQRMSQGV